MGSGLNDLTFVAAARRQGNVSGPAIFQASAGTIYFISVAGNSEVTGHAVLQIRPANTPPNDDFENRIMLAGLDVLTTGSNVEATKQPLPKSPFVPLFASSIGADLWWSWIAPTSGVFLVSTEDSSFQQELGIFTGTTLTNLVPIASAEGSRASLTFTAVAGMRYEIRVDTAYDGVGEVQLSITSVASPLNDACAQAIAIQGSSLTATGSTFGATAEPFEPAGANSRSVWWTWTPADAGAHKILATGAPTVRVYTGTILSNLALIASGEVVVLKPQPGVDYRIALDSPGGCGFR